MIVWKDSQSVSRMRWVKEGTKQYANKFGDS